ncbi:MAG TPA: hypothetical protein VMU00_13720 [Steroidobacteraceae bacterium]|nr:hypothetical protein [Steroidobacteraceae bacterium]
MSRAAQSTRRTVPAWLLLAATLLCAMSPAAARAAPSSFDHLTTGFELLGLHRDVQCAACHVGGIFKGTPTDCFSCHAAGSRFGATAKPTTHIVSGNNCAECHTPFSWTPVAKFNHLNVLGTCSSCHNNVQAIGKPSGHVPTTAECNQCHLVTQPWSTLNYPANHIPTSPTSQCTNCHAGSDFSVVPSLTNIHLYAPSTSGNCAQCHGAAAASFAIPAIGFAIVGMPAAHVPVGSNAACESCHVGAGSSVAATPVVDGARFSNSAMNHAGLTTCVACHGPGVSGAMFTGITTIVVMPATAPMGSAAHIPSGTACESCHLASMPAGLVPANATRTPPGTGFEAPAPTTAMIHAGITAGCASCHEGAYQWLDMTASYPLNPGTLSASTLQYMGFQTRPGKTASSTNLLDPAHPSSGDCSQCHMRTDYFEGQLKPSNHIPTSATAQCTDCHKSPDFSVIPALADIHANAPSTSSNCAQCHGPTVAGGFAIPAANFQIVTMPTGHVPTTAACESCHVGAGSSIAATPVPNGAKFSNSAMNHAGLTTCVSCHGPTVAANAFYGITRLIVMPATTPMGPSAHIPSATACEGCHAAPAGLVPGSAVATVPGTAFETPVPSTAQIHAGITSGCSSCHEGAYQWLDMTANYPLNPGTLTAGTPQYLGFQTRPGKAASSTNLLDNAHPSSGDCSQCHMRTDYFEAQLKPSNHIPTSTTAQCTDCHRNPDFSVLPALVDIHANAPSTSSNCVQCHGTTQAPTFAIPAANFQIVTMPTGHVPTTAACESCHVGAGSSIAATPVPNGAKFANSAMNHAGLTTCVGCHGPTVAANAFYGVTRLIVMPATTPMGPGAHIPSATACEGCHTAPAGFVPGSAVATVPGTAFQTPVPSTAQIHAGVTSNCASCHEGAYQWLDMTANYPLNPATLTVGTLQYMGFQTRPGKAASSTNLLDNAHPTSGDCAQCHMRTDYFEAQLKPSNHIPTSASAQCSDCHRNPDFSVLPALADIHANAPSTSSNCVQCHGTTQAPTFAIPAANFQIVTMPTNHVPTTAACESCHVGAASSIAATPVPNGAKFANSAMNHAGLTTCVGCHGPTVTGASFYGIASIVVMPASTPMGPNAHIPSATACETCHAGSMPSGLVPANATKTVPGTLFQTPVPTTAMIHAGITSGCASCHEGAYQWLDMTANYPLNPAALTGIPTTQYMGFQTRPGKAASSTNLLDNAHPTSSDCSQCHTRTDYFEGQLKPSNHIPTSATAQCANCHTVPDFSVMPTLLNIHTYAPSTTANCAQCHGPTVAGGFAIPAANFTIVTTPANHVPTSAACETCHVGAGSSVAATPVPNGAKFANSAMSHAGLTSCVGCHGPTVTGASFYGITSIVVMPPTSPVGAGSHIPSATACETCHAGSMPSAFVPANATKTAPGTAFAAPIPTTAMIHGGITSGCASCHEASYVWMDMSNYPISPTALTGVSTTQYIGFQTRPTATASTYSVADSLHPATGDCSQCHVGTTYFSAQAEPANHIPTLPGAACAVCHTTAGNFAVYTSNLTTLHSEVATTCSTCHADGKGPFAGAPGFAIVQMSTRGLHVPITNAGAPVECSGCHKSVTTFTGTIMSHAAIGDTQTAATGDACDACHEYGFRSKFYGISINWTRDSPTHHICGAAGTPTAPNTTPCTGGGSDCLQGCHEHQNQIPTKYATVKPGTPPKLIKSAATPPAANAPAANAPPASGGARRPGTGGALPGRLGGGGRVDHSALGGAACQSCHNGSAAQGKAAGHPATTAACGDCHSTLAWQPVLRLDHADVLGTCASCHDASHATGKPALHPLSGSDCDRCHTTSAWKPAAFDHRSVVAGTCATCHNALQAPGKPASHVATLLSCDACHYVLGWVPVRPAAVPPKPATKPVPRPATPTRGRDPSALAPPL